MGNRRGILCFIGLPVVLGAGAVAVLFFYPRPADTTDAQVFLLDGADLDYCVLPVLDGSGLTAAEIPKAFTPGCGWERWPSPVLGACTEPLAAGIDDLRGLWRSVDRSFDHVERIEQCGDRTVVTASGIIHDFRTDGTLANGSRDVEPPRCMNTWVAIEWRDAADGGRQMQFRPFGLPVVAVTRQLLNDVLVWHYPGRGEVRMERICTVPQTHRRRTAT